MRQYMLDSWEGKVSTPNAFWINLVLVQLTAGVLIGLVVIPLYVRAEVPLFLIDTTTTFVMGALLVWAGVGTWRSSGNLRSLFWKVVARVVTAAYVGLFLWSVIWGRA